MNSRIRELQDVTDVDVLIVGSSHAYRGFDPRIFEEHGIKAFNLGSSSQTPIQTHLLLNRYLNQLNPDIVIYEVFPNAFSVDGVESALDIISNDNNDMYSVRMALEVRSIVSINCLLYTVISESILQVMHKATANNEPGVIGPDTYVNGGYVEKDSSFHIDLPMIKQGNAWNLQSFHLRKFQKSLLELKERNIKVFLVYAPISKRLYDSYINNLEFEGIMDVFDEYGKYMNFNQFIDLNDSLHFYDSDHLNQNGVRIFNKRLIDTLRLIDYLSQDTISESK